MRGIVLLILILLGSASADTFSSDEAKVVYSKPNTESPVLGKLKAGREVEVEKRGTRWIRVLLKTSQGKKTGYILADREKPSESGAFSDFKGLRLGLSLHFSYYTQSSRVFTDSDGNQSDISNLSGTDPYFGIFAEYPASNKLQYRGGMAFRSISLQGTVRYRSGTVTTADTPVEIKQSFFSFIGGARYYFWGDIWGALFGEYAICSKSTVFGTASEKPNYFVLSPAIGYDYKIAKNFFLMPEFHLGIFVNTKPFMLNPELMVYSGYEF